MKALMIVDLHDDFPFESAKADIRIRANDKVIYRKHTKVWEMPDGAGEYFIKGLENMEKLKNVKAECVRRVE